MKLSEAQLSQLLNYNTHVLSLDQLIEEDFSSEGENNLTTPWSTESC